MTPYGNIDLGAWGNISSGNRLLPDRTKPLPEPPMWSCGIQVKAISYEMV